MNTKHQILTLLLLLTPSVALAQLSYKSEASFGLSRVLAYKGVSEDLEMDLTQTEKLQGLWTLIEIKLRQKFQEYRGNFSPRLSEEARDLLNEELADGVDAVRDIEIERLEEVLSASQIDRLRQIKFQLVNQNSGNLTYLKEDLDITRDQLADIKELMKKQSAERQKLRQNARIELLTPNEVAEFAADIAEDFEGQLRDILTVGQRQELERLQGKKFDFQIGTPKAESDQ